MLHSHGGITLDEINKKAKATAGANSHSVNLMVWFQYNVVLYGIHTWQSFLASVSPASLVFKYQYLIFSSSHFFCILHHTTIGIFCDNNCVFGYNLNVMKNHLVWNVGTCPWYLSVNTIRLINTSVLLLLSRSYSVLIVCTIIPNNHTWHSKFASTNAMYIFNTFSSFQNF